MVSGGLLPSGHRHTLFTRHPGGHTTGGGPFRVGGLGQRRRDVHHLPPVPAARYRRVPVGRPGLLLVVLLLVVLVCVCVLNPFLASIALIG